MKAIEKFSVRNVMRRFHNDEGGMETLQVVVIVAIAALVVLMINSWVGNADDGDGDGTIGGWVNSLLEDMFETDFGGEVG